MKNHFSATPDLTSGSEVLQAEITSLKQRVADLQAQTKHLANSALEAQEKLKQSEASLQTLNQLKTDLEQRTKETKQLAAKYEDANQENELLLLQLMQAQEELVEYYEQKGQFEKLYEGYKSRWDRLEKRLPDYVDFGAVELVGFDNVSDIPSLTWRIKEYAHAGVAIDELQFVTVLNDGHPGIGLVTDKEEPAVFVPQHLAKSANDVSHFLSYSASAYKQISVIALIFEQLEASQWQGFAFPANFDASFWRPPLKTLMAQLKALPPVLRYDDVVLKRELINPDYEHLWLEFKGLALGHTAWRKFEVRLGAALVQPTGFSQYPKFEFPLIDGKTKPFESWYAESLDDSGAKLELRFALDKQAFDNAVLAKLNDADRGLLLRLISAFPDALKRLSNKKTAIHRPWETWIGFASDAAKLLKALHQAPTPRP
ncbi:MAG: hypothetical protein EBZ60_03520 [Betaproteobacteria bacterium]|nr:hypothetical protein [Betaproteobacteria bacterium]